jgi:hypothetical protein
MLRLNDEPVRRLMVEFGRGPRQASRRLARPLAGSCCEARQFLGNEARRFSEDDGSQLV